MLEDFEIERLRRKEFLSIGEVADVIDSTPIQIRKWEREGLMPAPQKRVTHGTRVDRRYNWVEVMEMKRLRGLYRIGAPTAEDVATRTKIKESIRGKPA